MPAARKSVREGGAPRSGTSLQRTPSGGSRPTTGSCGIRRASRSRSPARNRPLSPRVPSPGSNRRSSHGRAGSAASALVARASKAAVSTNWSRWSRCSRRASTPPTSARLAGSGRAASPFTRRGSTPASRRALTASRTALRNPTPSARSSRSVAPPVTASVSSSSSSSNACSANSSSSVRPWLTSSAPTNSSATGRTVVTSRPNHPPVWRTSARRISRPWPRVGATSSVRAPHSVRAASPASSPRRAYTYSVSYPSVELLSGVEHSG